MKKLLLTIFFALFCCCGFAVSGQLGFVTVFADNENWRTKLLEEIQKYPQIKELDLHLAQPVIPDLPDHAFREIFVFAPYYGEPVLSLKPLSKYKLQKLVLTSGRYVELAKLDRSDLAELDFRSEISSGEFSGVDFPQLHKLYIENLTGDELDLSHAPRLEELRIFNSPPSLKIKLPAGVRLREIALGSNMLACLKNLDLAGVEKLKFYHSKSDTYSILHRLDLPKLKTLELISEWKGKIQLPYLPELRTLSIYCWDGVSLAYLQQRCPNLQDLSISGRVVDWDILPQMPLKKLHIGYVENVKYALPVAAPAGCEVTGLPPLIENPYKMWLAWAVIVSLFAAWVAIYQKWLNREAK